MKNVILLAKNQEYVSHKCEKSYFSTKYRISAQNRIRPSTILFDCDSSCDDQQLFILCLLQFGYFNNESSDLRGFSYDNLLTIRYFQSVTLHDFIPFRSSSERNCTLFRTVFFARFWKNTVFWVGCKGDDRKCVFSGNKSKRMFLVFLKK